MRLHTGHLRTKLRNKRNKKKYGRYKEGSGDKVLFFTMDRNFNTRYIALKRIFLKAGVTNLAVANFIYHLRLLKEK